MSTTALTSLPELSEQINHHHRECVEALNEGLRHGLRAGQLLVEAKEQLAHGQWTPWLEAHFEGSARTAQLYMRVAKHWPEIEAKAQGSAVLTLDGVTKMLAQPKTAPAVEQTPVDWFTEEALLTADHVHELYAIREVMGEDIDMQFNRMELPFSDHGDAAIILHRLAPEQRAALYRPGDAVLGLLNRFFAHSNTHDCRLPAWQCAAFWWGCLAVQLEIRAGDLARGVDAWLQRFASAVAVVFPESGLGPDGGRWFQEARADLHHAGCEARVLEGHMPLFERAIELVCKTNTVVPPLAIQDLLRRLEDRDDTLSEAEQKAARRAYYQIYGTMAER